MRKADDRNRRALGNWIILVIIVAALIVAGRFVPLKEWGQSFTDWIQSLGRWGYVALFLAFAIGAPLFAPGWLLSVVAGVAFGVVRGSVIALTGATTGAALGFLAGRHLFRKRIEQWAKKHNKFRIIDEGITRKDWQTVMLLRLTPIIPFCIVNYLLALTRVRTDRFLFATFFGLIPGTVLHVYLGYVGRAALMRDERGTAELVYLGVGLVAAAGLTFYLTRFAKRRLAEIGEEKESQRNER